MKTMCTGNPKRDLIELFLWITGMFLSMGCQSIVEGFPGRWEGTVRHVMVYDSNGNGHPAYELLIEEGTPMAFPDSSYEGFTQPQDPSLPPPLLAGANAVLSQEYHEGEDIVVDGTMEFSPVFLPGGRRVSREPELIHGKIEPGFELVIIVRNESRR
jgi:hypothetical protein